MRSVMVVLLVLAAAAQGRAESLEVAPAVPGPGSAAPPSAGEGVSRSALRTYALRRVGLELYSDVDDDGSTSATGLQPYLGKYRQPLELDAFYDLVGRSDLARAYRTRSAVKTGLLVASVGATVAALGFGLRLLTSSPDASSCDSAAAGFEACQQQLDQQRSSRTVEGVLLTTGAAALGPGLIVGVALYDPNPAEPWQMRQLADEYNTRLRTQLGLPEDENDFAGALWRDLSFAPVVSPTGAGLAMHGRF